MRILNLALKRLFDIVSSFLAIVLLLPLFLIVAIAIKCDSKGPVFFKQERRTRNGKVFGMLKFRSMVVNAETMGAGLFNYENDQRVTKVGRFIRKTSIDELPQLFNILIGQMSVVGPRPCVRYELGDFDTLNRKYKKRFEMKAGLTGLAKQHQLGRKGRVGRRIHRQIQKGRRSARYQTAFRFGFQGVQKRRRLRKQGRRRCRR